MTTTDLQPRLAACFAAVFPDLTPEEIPTASMASLAAWDSLATATLIPVIEEEFRADISPDDLANFISFELILDYLAAKSQL